VETYARDYAILPKGLLTLVDSLIRDKNYDFCFIGSFAIRPSVKRARAWIIPFVQSHFTARSFLQFTDNATRKDYVEFGSFDFTLRRNGFVPREVPMEQRGHLDLAYYEIMCQSQFALCPAGDSPWSMRLYEALVCGAIPVVKSAAETARTPQEAQLGYKFYLASEKLTFREDWVEHNRHLAHRWHTLMAKEHTFTA